ncbi:MAG: sugar ABC transporter substrate-binding protein [Planctomycetales bacterium]|nr:sugar ABC transporter substrate-binding protein [Planctomycetales bacterium]
MNLRNLILFLSAACVLPIVGCTGSKSGSAAKQGTVGIAFETLQTEYWVAGFDAIKEELEKRDFAVLEAIADGDPNRQLQQVKNFITRRVDGIVLVPKDANSCIPAIRAANEAGIPIVLFNRPAAAEADVQSVAVQADNYKISLETVGFMIEQARKTGTKHKAMIVMGDLGDINAIGRRDGFDAAVKGNEDVIDVVARVPSEWNQEKAQAGVVNALQANPDISFLFTSSDFLLPSIVSALKSSGKYEKIGQPGHVILGGFDGDATAYQMLKDGYLDATGVQDVYFEAQASVQALLDLMAGKEVEPLIHDPGFVIHQGNEAEMADRTWGAKLVNSQE